VSADTIRTIFDVASLTSVLVLLVLGMAVIVGMMRVFNLCHGELVLLGAVVAYLSHSWFGSVALGIVLAPLVVGLFGAGLERTVVRRFYANPAGALLATFAVGFLIRAIVLARMSTQGAPVPAPVGGTVTIGAAHVSAWPGRTSRSLARPLACACGRHWTTRSLPPPPASRRRPCTPARTRSARRSPDWPGR
jgi:branched-chain amino acid transport system permease protein